LIRYTSAVMFWYLASSSMIMPKERFGRRSISQRKVKWSLGASSCSRWSTSEVWINALAAPGALGFCSDVRR